jgi:hypothetical protein
MSTLTYEMIKEASELLKASAPPKAPETVNAVQFPSGLNIIRNNLIPSNTVMVSEELFDMIFTAGSEPLCQNCLKNPCTMQNDDGDYLCLECYSGLRNKI